MYDYFCEEAKEIGEEVDDDDLDDTDDEDEDENQDIDDDGLKDTHSHHSQIKTSSIKHH